MFVVAVAHERIAEQVFWAAEPGLMVLHREFACAAVRAFAIVRGRAAGIGIQCHNPGLVV